LFLLFLNHSCGKVELIKHVLGKRRHANLAVDRQEPHPELSYLSLGSNEARIDLWHVSRDREPSLAAQHNMQSALPMRVVSMILSGVFHAANAS
jgi:hypothetical protein